MDGAGSAVDKAASDGVLTVARLPEIRCPSGFFTLPFLSARWKIRRSLIAQIEDIRSVTRHVHDHGGVHVKGGEEGCAFKVGLRAGNGQEGIQEGVLGGLGRAFEVEDLLEVGKGGITDDERVVEDEALGRVLCGM